MAGQQDDPVVLRRRLRTELRALRRKSDETQEQVAKALDWSTSKILRIEGGDSRVTPSDVRLLTMHYGLTDKRRVDQLVNMARAARTDSFADFRDVHQAASVTFFGYEAAANRIRDFSVTLIPGLLQTEEYAKELLEHTFGHDDPELERRWMARERRQNIFDRDELPDMHFLFDEGVVRRLVANPRVMIRQLERLLELAGSPDIDIRIIPFAAGAHAGMQGPFVVLELPNPQDDDILYLEHVDGDKVVRDDPDETAKYTSRFFDLTKVALSQDETTAFLRQLIVELGGRPTPAADQKEATE